MTSGKYVAESVFLEAKRGRKLEEERGEGADESVEGYIDGFRKVMCIPWMPTVQSRYDDAFSKSVNNDTPHSSKGSSFASIFLNRESLKALMSAYSAMPSRIDMGSKLPMQPLSLVVRPGREDLMFQVTKRGNLWSRKEGEIGVLPVRAQYKASKAWKQCSGVQVLSTSTAARPPGGLTGRRDMAAKGRKT
jgi:hypothetical protein